MAENIDLTELIIDLNDADQPTRQQAYHQLVAMGQAVVPDLLEAFPDISGSARLSVVRAFGDLGDRRAGPLLASLIRSKNPQEYFFISSLAAKSLGQIGDLTSARGLLRDRQPSSRRMAVVIMGNIGAKHARHEQAAVNSLAQALTDRDEKTRQLAVQALRKIGSPQALRQITARQNGHSKPG